MIFQSRFCSYNVDEFLDFGQVFEMHTVTSAQCHVMCHVLHNASFIGGVACTTKK
jgi:hypothetical protein